MSPQLISTLSADQRIATLILNRPEARNALNAELISELTQAIATLPRNPNLRAIVITGKGDAFCAGTDVTWMRDLARGQADEDARRLSSLLFQIRNCPCPVVARVNGAAIGTGVGLLAAADIAVAHEDVLFQLPAVRLGVVPAVITPFLIEAMGVRHTQRYAITGEPITALDARRVGLVQAVCLDAHLDETIRGMTDGILKGGPTAVRATKTVIKEFRSRELGPKLLDEASKFSAKIRKTEEAQEGLHAMMEGELPSWRKDEAE